MANLLSNTTIGGYQSIHTGNIGSYALTSLPSHNHDDRYYTEGESDSRYLRFTGAELTEGNYFQFRSNRGSYLGTLDSPSLQVYSTGGNSAFMSFHRGGSYAVNFGLDADNVMRIGGWSASSNRWQLDMSGNNTIAGNYYGGGAGLTGTASSLNVGSLGGYSLDTMKKYIWSRGENLLTNGTGLMGNNTNFSSFTFDGSQAYFSSGSFKYTGQYNAPNTDELMPMNPEKRYRLDFWAKTSNGQGAYYAYLNFFDVDGNAIYATNHMYYPNTLTTLAQTLNPGDTVVYLTSAANWENGGTAGVSTHIRSFIFWNYSNSFGYLYPPQTYSRNWYGGMWNPGAVNYSNNTITLISPWSGPSIAAGTKLSNGSAGGTFKYIALGYTIVPTTWTNYVGIMDGVDYSGSNAGGQFPPGTAAAKLGFLTDYNASGDTIYLANLFVGVDNDYPIYDRWTGSTRIEKSGAFYGTVFYDSNNSGYYLDPSSTSNLNRVDAASQMRAPIFYDSQDTNYYLDPNSTSRLVTVNADLLRSYGNVYTDGSYGHGLVGLYSAERYQGVFAMGDSYKLAANGTSTGNLYGIAWTHTNVGGQSKSGLGHQALFMMNGQTYTAIGSGIWTDGTITTTSHGTSANWKSAYDWGNHASVGYLTSLPSHNHDDRYYTETESDGRFQPLENQRLSTGNSPTFANVYATAWFRNYGAQGMYNQDYGTHFYSLSSGAWAITGSGGAVELQFRSNHQSTLRGYVYANTSNEIGFLSEDGNWVLKTWNRGVEAYGSMRAPIFYDSQDTSYYVDPNSSSRVSKLWVDKLGGIGTYSWVNAAITTSSIEIVNQASENGSLPPTLAFHWYGDGGPQFRLAADTSNILYLESAAANSANTATNSTTYFNSLRLICQDATGLYVNGNGVWHRGDFSSTNVSNWNTAYSWGNHASAGYINTSYLDDYTRGGYRVISDYNTSSTWYLRSNGQFIWGLSHDWSYSFRLSLPSGSQNNTTWAYFGQQDSNAGSGTWRGVRIRKYASGSVDGDLSAGAFYIGDTRKDLLWDTAYNWGNHASAGYLTGITSGQVTSALGYTPYNSSNPSGYITSSSLSSYLPLAGGTMSGKVYTLSTGTGTYDGAFEIRETSYVTTSQSAWGYAPGITYHWGGRVVSKVGLRSDGLFAIDNEPFATYSWVNSQGFQSASTAITTSNIGSQSVTYATNSTRLYASDSPYTYGGGAPYYLYMNYDGGSYWELKVSPATPGAVRVAYSNVSGSSNSVAWTNVSSRPTALSQFTNDLGNYGGWITSSGSISGNAATATSATYLNSSNYISQRGSNGSWNADFTSTAAGTMSYGGDLGANGTNGPGGSWWIQQNFRHTNSSNYWGTQVAWGWEDNANRLATRNITGGSYGAWVYYLNSSNFTSYAPSLTGSGASGTWGISVTGNAATVGGYAVSAGVGANTVVIREGNGYAFFNYINSNVSETENPTINSFYTSNGDGYFRKSTVAHVKSQLGLGSLAYSSATIPTNNNQLTNGAGYITSSGSISGNAATATNVAWTGVTGRPTALSQFSNDLGNYGGWLTTGGKAADSELFDGTDSIYFVKGNGTNALGRTTTNNSGGNSAGGLSSGFYDGSGMSNMPTSDWYHLIVNAHHNSATSNQYEFQLATAFWDKSNFYVRSISPGDVGPWRTLIHNGNIGSQSVSYASTAGSATSATTAGTATIASQLNKFGDIYGQDWNTYYVQDKLIAAAVYGHSGANRPNLTYDYGVALSYGESTGPRMQMYFPENSGNIGTIFRKATYRTGWNGNWSTWKTIVEQEGNTCTIVGGNGTGLEVHGNVGYNQDPLTYFLLRGQADTSWKALKVRLTGDAGGQDIEFRRIAENGADSRMWYVPRGGNTVNFEYPIVQPSDSRLKDNITPISTPIDKIKSLRGVEFDWNSGEQVGTHDVGLIAQEVEAVLPEAVTTQEDGYKNLAYTKVIPLLVEAMKEQQAMIEALKAEIELLKNK